MLLSSRPLRENTIPSLSYHIPLRERTNGLLRSKSLPRESRQIGLVYLCPLRVPPSPLLLYSAAAELLRGYEGDFVVESFDPVTVGKFKKLMPEVQRGILSMHFTKKKTHRSLKNYLAEMLVFNRIASPDFVAFCHSDASFASFKFVRGVWDAYTVAWTVRSKEEEDAAIKNGFDCVIFENYIPE